MYFKLLILAAFLAVPCLAETVSLILPDAQMELSKTVTRLTMELRYDEALRTAGKLRSMNDGVGCILENVVRISRYDDLGDTAALLLAGTELEKCKATGMWEALRKFEFGYVQSESGHSIKGALQTRSAAKIFEDSKEQEARAFYAIYAYYVDKSFSWVPFMSDNRSAYLSVLDSASITSERFWPLFLVPLVWMHYDNGDFSTGLSLAERGLSRAPNHPVMLQIMADMLYRLKRYDEASAIYGASAADYLKRTGKSIRYWCSILNLVRIYADAGKKAKVEEMKAKLKDPEFERLRKWMPGSLMSDLENKKLI